MQNLLSIFRLAQFQQQIVQDVQRLFNRIPRLLGVVQGLLGGLTGQLGLVDDPDGQLLRHFRQLRHVLVPVLLLVGDLLRHAQVEPGLLQLLVGPLQRAADLVCGVGVAHRLVVGFGHLLGALLHVRLYERQLLVHLVQLVRHFVNGVAQLALLFCDVIIEPLKILRGFDTLQRMRELKIEKKVCVFLVCVLVGTDYKT